MNQRELLKPFPRETEVDRVDPKAKPTMLTLLVKLVACAAAAAQLLTCDFRGSVEWHSAARFTNRPHARPPVASATKNRADEGQDRRPGE
jgi:hypothetical protein